jgi:predicted transcriptional regulator
VRAQAQEIYRERAAAPASEACLLPNPPPQAGEGIGSARGRERSEIGHGAAQNLTARDLTAHVRALYEGSAVPVAEIARLVGVTERTIYKYAAKQGWKPRYAWRPGGGRPPKKPQGAGKPALRREQRRQAQFAPAKGAGGRFIRRADKVKPFAVGLKATDPAAARRAAAQCAEAERRAQEAQLEALRSQLADERVRALTMMSRVAKQLVDFREERKARNGDARLDTVRSDMADTCELGLRATLDAAMDWAKAVRREEAKAWGLDEGEG